MEDDADLLSVFKTDFGKSVMLYAEHITRVFGGYGLTVNPDGSIEILMIGPDGGVWESIDNLRPVEAGRARTSTRRQ